MHNFFVLQNQIIEDKVSISGKDFNHVKNVLRMKVGDEFLISIFIHRADSLHCTAETNTTLKAIIFQ